MSTKVLIPKEEYLKSGIHIGMKQRTAQMKEFIYKIRPDGLAILDWKKTDERIRVAANFLSRLQKVIVVSRKSVSRTAIEKFGEAIGAQVVTGRFMPGTLTNPSYKKFFEAQAMIIVEPLMDYQALKEAVKARVLIVAVANTFDDTKDIDLIIPANNKSERSIGLVFWLLAREIQKLRGVIKEDSEFSYKVEDFVGEVHEYEEREPRDSRESRGSRERE